MSLDTELQQRLFVSYRSSQPGSLHAQRVKGQPGWIYSLHQPQPHTPSLHKTGLVEHENVGHSFLLHRSSHRASEMTVMEPSTTMKARAS